jgi:hypothetical protein
MSITVSKFNSTVLDLINDLSTAIPSFTDLSVVSTLANGMYKLDPHNTTVLETFYPYVLEHENLINTRADDAIMSILRSLLPGQYSKTADYIWGELTEENKQTVWSYIELLCQQAHAIKGSKPMKSATTDKKNETSETSDAEAECTTQEKELGISDGSEVFVLYNNVWKEFFTQLKKYDNKNDNDSNDNNNVWDKCLEAMTSLSSSSCQSKFHHEFASILTSSSSPLSKKGRSATDMISLILPKDEAAMRKEAKNDSKTIGKRCLPLVESVPIERILQTIKLNANVPELPTYWHYIKVLTIILSECPPELAELLSSMSSGLSSIVGSAQQTKSLSVA